jgi:hypothetical protein
MATLATVASSSVLLVALARLRCFVLTLVLAMVLKVFSFSRTTSRAGLSSTEAAGAGSARGDRGFTPGNDVIRARVPRRRQVSLPSLALSHSVAFVEQSHWRHRASR